VSLLHLDEVTRTVTLPDGSPLTILSGVNLTAEAGDHLAVVGRSGSGKSTLLNIIGMLDAPTSGTVMMDEVDVNRYSSGRRYRLRGRDIGFIFQQFNLLQARTAVENVAMPLMYARGKQFWNRERIAAEMLDRVGMSHRLTSMPHRLSGGEQQRVAIARALVRGPRVLLADEPTGALDLETGATVMALLDEITTEAGAALITITHDPAVAALARVRYLLDRGVLTASAPAMSIAEATESAEDVN